MGFYGNIKDVEKNNSFVFDKIYANRKQMDENAQTDGIFVGRYVLVEYDTNTSAEDYKRAYLNPERKDIKGHNVLYYGSDFAKETTILYNEKNIVDGDNILQTTTFGTVVYILNEQLNVYYTCVGYFSVDEKGVCAITLANGTTINYTDISLLEFYTPKINYALFDKIENSSIDAQNNYAINYNIDVKYAKDKGIQMTGHGWDSTVWQKTTYNNKEKYVMIAELNTVVPTFDLAVDAPTQMPIAPHFDAASTDVYYKLHWQPNWGLRTQLADASLSEGESINISDATTSWVREIYDKETGKSSLYYYTKNKEWKEITDLKQIGEDGKLPAAIYYNKAGFDARRRYRSSLDNVLKVDTTGYSQTRNKQGVWEDTKYNSHFSGEDEKRVDTQELSMILPGIGNAVSDMWDIVYGKGNGQQKDDEISERAMDISWSSDPVYERTNRLQLIKSSDNGQSFTYNKSDVETLAGALNSVHDLMGMIIKEEKDIPADLQKYAESADNNSIYLLKDKFYRKALLDKYKNLKDDEYIYEEVENLKEKNFNTWTYYVKDEEGNYIPYTGVYDSSKGPFYIRKVKSGMTEVEVTTFDEIMSESKNTYLYQNANGDYIYENQYYKNRQYYLIDKPEQSITLSPDYKPETYYYKGDTEQGEQDNFYLDTGLSEAKSPLEYELKADPVARLARNIYVPGRFFSKSSRQLDNSRTDEIFAKDRLGKRDGIIYYTIKTNISLADITPASQGGNLNNNEFIVYREKAKVQIEEEHGGAMRKMYYYSKPNSSIQDKVWEERENVYRYAEGKLRDTLVERVDGDSIRKAYRYYYDSNETYIVYAGSLDSDLITLDENKHPIFYTFNPYDAEFQTVNELCVMTPTVALYPEITKDDYYLFQDKNYIRISLNLDVPEYGTDDGTIFYVAEFQLHSETPFYQSNKYYYQGKDKKSWYKDTNGAFDSETTYYDLTNKIHATTVELDLGNKVLYEPGKYYYKSNNRYYIDNSATPTKDQYYTGNNNFFVVKDEKGTLSYGAYWNTQLPVPHYITLGVKDATIATMKELVGFSKSLNTIHGLILQINNFLEYGNETTRNTSTVQGVINTLNDLITNFAILDYAQFVVTDSYGRMHTAEAADDQWINSYVEPDVETPIVHVHHTINKINNEKSAKNLNTDKDDVIVINQPTPDKMGHIVNKNEITYTLPYGIKEIHADTGQFVAENTQDSFTIKKGNEWIKTEIVNGNDELAISHTINKIDDEEQTAIDLNTAEEKNKIIINQPTPDDMGHIVNAHNIVYTLPYGIKTINADEGSYSAATTQSDFNIKTKDAWLDTKISNNELLIEHKNAKVDDIKNTQGLAQDSSPKHGGSFVIPQIGIDEKGHVAVLKQFNLTLPSLSLTPGANGNVVSSISLNAEEGQFTEAKVNAGDLVLNTYSASTSDKAISNTDTISEAIAKNAYKLSILNGSEETVGSLAYESKARSDADKTLDGKIGELNTALGEVDGRLQTIEGYDLNSRVNSNASAITTINTDISDLGKRITTIENQKYSTQINSLKSDTEASLSAMNGSIQGLTTAYNNQQATIEALTQRIAALEGTS